MKQSRARFGVKVGRSTFLQSMLVIVSGTALGQGIVVLASPLLTRLYSPADMGTLAVFTSVLSVLSVIANLRFEVAIPLPKSDKVAAHLAVLALLIGVGTSLLTAIFAVALSGTLTNLIGMPQIQQFVWMLPIAVLVTSHYQVLSYWAVRTKRFGSLGQSKLISGVTTALAQVTVGLIRPMAVGLVGGQVLGLILGNLRFLIDGRRGSLSTLLSVSKQGLASAFIEFRHFPLYSSWSGLANVLSMQVSVLVIAAFFGATEAGLYALGLRVLQTPMSLVGRAISQVFLSDAAGLARTDRLSQATEKLFVQLIRMGFPVLLIIALSAPTLFSIIFGAEWRMAGVYSQWLSPWLLLVFIGSPLSTLPAVLGKQRTELWFQVALLAARVLVLFTGARLGDVVLTVAMYAAVSFLFWMWFILWTQFIVGNLPFKVLSTFTRQVSKALPLAGPTVVGLILTQFTATDLYVIIGAVISGLMILASLLIQRRPRDLR